MTIYKLRTLLGNAYVEIGEPEVNFRKCRFCGKGISDGAKFEHVSHAISQSLGNNMLFALDECDDCNQKFSILEQNLGNLLSLMLYTYDIKGKSSKKNPRGLRKMETPDYKFSTEGNMKVVIVKNWEQRTLLDELKHSGTINLQSMLKFDKYIPLNVYKTFCKFAINLINAEDVNHFSKLIRRIKEDDVFPFNPIIFVSPCSMANEQPIFMYFTQSTSNKEPFCIVCFLICNLIFLVEIPSDRTFDVKDNENRINAINALGSAMFPNHIFQEMNLSGTNLETMPLKFEISIPQNLREGTDYFVASSKQEVENLIARFGKLHIE